MNIFSIIGFIMAITVLFVGLKLASPNIMLFVDYPSMFIVVGATIASTAISFQLNRMALLFKVFFQRVIKGQKFDYSAVIVELMQISEGYRKGETPESFAAKVKDPFLKEALDLMSDKVLEKEHLIRVLGDRVESMMEHHMDETRRMKAVAKFPPAFGMMGTTIGMIVLLANLGGADAMKMIGPAMGVCLITTLYGVIIANLAVVPVAENLHDGSKEIYLKNSIIVEGIKLMLEKTNPIIVAIELNSFLPPSQRLDWKEVVGK